MVLLPWIYFWLQFRIFNVSSCFLFAGFCLYLNMTHGVSMPPDQYWFCVLANTTFFTSTSCSTYLIISMTFDRFYSIIRPHKAASFNTVKRAKITIVSIVIFSFLFNIPHVLLTSNEQRQCVPFGKAVGLPGQFYYWLSFIANFAFPFMSLLTMNSVIIHSIRKSFKIRSKRTSNEEGHGQGEGQSTRRSETQVFATLLLVTFAFLILTTPAYVFFLYVQFFNFTKTPYRFAGFHLFYHVAQKLQYTNYGINFFLYVISGRKFRADLSNLVQCNKIKMIKEKNESSTNISHIAWSLSGSDTYFQNFWVGRSPNLCKLWPTHLTLKASWDPRTQSSAQSITASHQSQS